jgi:hypothetical protein
MRTHLPAIILFFGVLVLNAAATVRYVDLTNPNPTPPYTSWATAATNIQDAIDLAVDGDLVLTTNGVYQTGGQAVYGTMTNRVAVTKAVAVQSVNGPLFTVIQGRQLPGITNGDGAIRCVYLTNGASLAGFTLTNGGTRTIYDGPDYSQSSGGGIWCEPVNVVISNCVVAGNSANERGGGVYRGAVYYSVLVNNNVKELYNGFGGGAHSSTLIHCILKNNSSAHDAGGAIFSALTNCTITGNSSAENGGGTSLSTLMNCIVSSNSAYFGGGTYDGNIYNCILVRNSAQEGGGADHSGSISLASLNNCTVIFNTAIYGGGARYCTLNNCIVYSNTAPNGSNYESDTLNFCCATPLAAGAGNFTNAPNFIDAGTGNLRLQSNSPCINAGNNSYVASSVDLDSRPRIVGDFVDIGAYEFQTNASGLFIGWMQQYGLPTDGSADFSDSDGDGMDNWGEWRSDTIPTNALSVLRITSASKSVSGLDVSWQSVPTRSYSLERTTALGVGSSFQTIASNIAGAFGFETFTDAAATNAGPYFYRIRVQ